MRIHIIGASGSGKSRLARRLAERYSVPHCDLDDLFWDNSSGAYGVKTPVDERARRLEEIVREDGWIVEGVYYAWVKSSLERADRIILLDIPGLVCNARVRRRFIRRKLGLEEGGGETLRSVRALIRWSNGYRRDKLPEIYRLLGAYPDKTVVLHSARQVNAFIDEPDDIE